MTATVFSGGPILTMETATSTAEVVVTEGEQIVAVGAAALARRYPDAHRVELGGRTLVPGFIDAHSHLCIAALHPRWADLADVRDPDGLRAALTAQARAEPDAGWVRGVGWSDLDDGFTPTRADLDGLGLDGPSSPCTTATTSASCRRPGSTRSGSRRGRPIRRVGRSGARRPAR